MKKKIRKIIVKTITGIAFVLFWVSLCAIDSQSWIPAVIFALSWCWLMFYAWANGYFYESPKKDGADDVFQE